MKLPAVANHAFKVAHESRVEFIHIRKVFSSESLGGKKFCLKLSDSKLVLVWLKLVFESGAA